MKRMSVLCALLACCSTAAFGKPTIHYATSNIEPSREKCLARANDALNEAGYKVGQSTTQHVLGTKGEFIATIVCTAYQSGVAFIVVNGIEASPKDDLLLIFEKFSSTK